MLNWRLSLPSLRRCRSDKSDRDPKEEPLLAKMATGGVTSVYVGIKHAVEGITKSVALEIAKSGSSGALRHATRSGPAASPVNLWVQPLRRWRPAGRGHGRSNCRRGPAWDHG